jgi:hypothetical protein
VVKAARVASAAAPTNDRTTAGAARWERISVPHDAGRPSEGNALLADDCAFLGADLRILPTPPASPMLASGCGIREGDGRARFEVPR